MSDSPPPALPLAVQEEVRLPPLRSRRRRFIEEYLIDGDATRAATAAGYSAATAGQAGYYLLQQPNVQAELQKQRAVKSQELKLSAERVLREHMRIAFADMHLLYDEDGRLLPITEQPEDVRRAVQEVIHDYDKDGNPRIKIKLLDKHKSLDTLTKHLGLFEADNKQRGEAIVEREYSEIEIARRIAYVLHRGGKALEELEQQQEEVTT